jgi:ubiquinone/menaquinone biosynthesis C-methylase UbiE
MFEKRVTDYDSIADDYDARYDVYEYGGVRTTLLGFLGDGAPLAILEVGCGTGHWLAEVLGRLTPSARLTPSPYANDDARSPSIETPSARLTPSPYANDDASSPSIETRSAKASAERHLLAGVDPSAPMLARARLAAPAARLVRARAENLPWLGETFDRIFCVNALHHFVDRARFFEEARRLLRPGGGLLTIGKDPHVEQDSWWVYDYFTETREIDKARYARVRTLRGEMAHAGFAWADSGEADRIEAVRSFADATKHGMIARSFTSQLTVLSDDEFNQGMERLRAADAAAGGGLQLVSDFRLYATVGWV